ncbi:MAG: hypothetical protein VYA34_03895 [Myxococcota bacterium]|nr:hypothetical protein [Myxococcota bacterium]
MTNFRLLYRGFLLCSGVVVSLLWTGSVLLAGDKGGVVESVSHGEIHWGKGTLVVTGSGAPDLRAPNAAVARLGAERAAKMSAFRNILEAVQGARVQSGQTVGDLLATQPEMRTKVQGVVRNFKVLDTRYYSDGGVDLVVEVPLSGVLLETLVPAGASGDTATAGGRGVLIQAKGMKLVPALAPKILDESGNELYSAAIVNQAAALKWGYVAYYKTLKQAKKDVRIGKQPLIVKALRPDTAGGSDIVLEASEVSILKSAMASLRQGRIGIIVD